MAKHVPTTNGTEMTGATSLVKSLEAAGVDVIVSIWLITSEIAWEVLFMLTIFPCSK